MAHVWVGAALGVVGILAWRSWRQDAAWRSGELMDVRDVLPSGEGHVEVRVLANRRYRVELQIEARLATTHDASAATPRADDTERAFPFELVVSRADGGPTDALVHQTVGALEPLLGVATDRRVEQVSSPGGAIERACHAGAVPLLELVADGLVRLRFELAVRVEHRRTDGEHTTTGRLEKAFLVVKEEVRPLRGRGLDFERIEVPTGVL